MDPKIPHFTPFYYLFMNITGCSLSKFIEILPTPGCISMQHVQRSNINSEQEQFAEVIAAVRIT